MSVLVFLLLPALAMSVGWGFRGDYGHEAGAMVPGALVALAVCLASQRSDWWGRASVLGMLGAIGWAFGGQMSYGRIVGYTMHSSFWDVSYGFACLFVIGALWGGIGAGILALGVTRPRAELERLVGPVLAVLVAWLALDSTGVAEQLGDPWSTYDVDWVAAASALVVAGVYALAVPRARRACVLVGLLAGGWWLGFGLLTLGLGLRMTPPRSDNWAGCIGLFAGLLTYLVGTRNRAALMLTWYGLLAGGLGFLLGDFVQVLARAQWGPIGRCDALQHLDYWKWMEQLFGLVMGLGVAMGFWRLLRGGLRTWGEEAGNGLLGYAAPLFLLVVVPWLNLSKNVRNWTERGVIKEGLFGLDPAWWFLLVGILLAAMVVLAVVRHRRGGLALAPRSPLGRAQLLFLAILWLAVIAAFMQALPGMKSEGALFVHTTFWITAAACSLIVLALPRENGRSAPEGRAEPSPPAPRAPENLAWLPGTRWVAVWAVLLPLLILLLAQAAISTHEGPLPGWQ